MDTTYFWRKYGIMIFRIYNKDKKLRKNLLRYKVNHETVYKYKEWIKYIQSKWFEVLWIICDGGVWLLWWFWDILTQKCVFHQQQTITKYLTKKPKSEAWKGLLDISYYLWKFKKKTIIMLLNQWLSDHKQRLNELNNNWNKLHIRTFKAYKSIVNNLKYLYIYDDYHHLNIPKTNNSLEAINSWIKTKSWLHRWLSEKRKWKYICYYLYNS